MHAIKKLILLFVLLCAAQAFGTAAYVQEKDCAGLSGGGTSEACAFSGIPGSTDGIVVFIAWGTNSSTISSVADGNSVAYSSQAWASGATNCSANGANMLLYVLPNSAGNTGAKTITVTWSADPGFWAISEFEASGVPTSSMVDKADCQNVNATTAPASLSVTTTGADFLAASSFSNGASAHTWTAGTSPAYTFRGTTGKLYANETFVQTAGAAITGNFTISGGGDNFQTGVVALKPTGGATVTNPPHASWF
jgi:hypothetical protein